MSAEVKHNPNQAIQPEHKGYSAAIASCPAACPGRRSPWQPQLKGADFPCPLGVAFCGAWNPDALTIKKVRKPAVAASTKEVA